MNKKTFGHRFTFGKFISEDNFHLRSNLLETHQEVAACAVPRQEHLFLRLQVQRWFKLFGLFGFISSYHQNYCIYLAIFPIATRFFASSPIENFQKFHLLQNIVLLLKLAEKGNQERKRYLDINLNLSTCIDLYLHIEAFRFCWNDRILCLRSSLSCLTGHRWNQNPTWVCSRWNQKPKKIIQLNLI